MKKLTLGAPSLTGKDANDLVAAAFKAADFPLQMVFTNLAAHALSFPEIGGLHLKPCTHGDEATVVATVPNYDALQRLTSSIEQIAELNHNEAMLEMVVFDAEAAEKAAQEAEALANAEAAEAQAILDAEAAEKAASGSSKNSKSK